MNTALIPAVQERSTALTSMADAAVTAGPLEVLTCQLGGVSYGIELRCVQEIRSYEAPTRIANAPDFIKGFVNLRGVIVPVIDLRLSFGLPVPAYDAFTITVVLNLADRIVGVVVDSVSDVIALLPSQIKPAPDFNDTVDARYIAGIGTPDESSSDARMLVLLDIEKLMSSAAMGLVQPVLQ
ncbi:chemotaxis protein CheW [Roseateles microcysteis]|uniref:chemotaxis protein CheW n=1 Tax=Roseateles microcysteis TaxID=3119057 RepID=UPI002FE5FEFE